MHYIKEIVQKQISQATHKKFTRYSRGDFIGPLLIAKITKKIFRISLSFHFLDEILKFTAKTLDEEIVEISGMVISQKDLSSEFSMLNLTYLKLTKATSLFKYKIEFKANLKNLLEAFQGANLLISIKSPSVTIKSKTVPVKPNKEIASNYVKLVTSDENLKDLILKEFLFDQTNIEKIKEINIKHEIKVTDIILPEDKSDFEEVRKKALRKGILKRIVETNKSGELVEKDIEFTV